MMHQSNVTHKKRKQCSSKFKDKNRMLCPWIDVATIQVGLPLPADGIPRWQVTGGLYSGDPQLTYFHNSESVHFFKRGLNVMWSPELDPRTLK